MIKAGIIGGDACITGDLLRLLLHHPDVEIMWVADSRLAGHRVDATFPDLIGDTDLTFASTPEYAKLDVVFVLSAAGGFAGALENTDLRVIVLGEPPREDFIHGLPELNRKAMVRGGRRVIVPAATEGLIELALLPMAKNLMLNSPIHVNVIDPGVDGSSVTLDSTAAESELTTRICDTLRQLQASFNAHMDVLTVREPAQDGILAAIYFDCPIDIDELVRLYSEFFEDHRFTFVSRGTVATSAVLRTNKCMIGLQKTSDKLLITAAIDQRLKGCAGTAVHSMNLLFGLHERTGF